MSNNLRIIYDNLVDASTTTVSATNGNGSTPIANLKLDSKSKVWRTTAKTTVITVNFGSTKQIGGVILPFCNLTTSATIRLQAGALDRTVTAAPYTVNSIWNYTSPPLGVTSYSYGGGTYARIWTTGTTQVSASSVTITITDNSNSSSYLEFSRLIVGPYWSPRYNTSYGLSSGTRDLTKLERTESGDLISIRGPRFNTLSFDLRYMDQTDRNEFMNILRGNGIAKSLYVSLFPEDTDVQREHQHQIYGKLTQLSPINYPFLDIYSTSLELEEV